MPDIQPTVPNYPPQGIQAQLDLIYLWNPDVAKELIEKLESGLASLEELTQEINDALSKVKDSLEYKGELESEIDLPETRNTVGDLYYITTTEATFFWSGSEWLKMGGNVDLTPYLTKTEAQETYATQEAIEAFLTKEAAAETYTTKEDVETALEPYLTKETADETYSTPASVETALEPYMKTEDADAKFATSEAVKTELEDYVTKEDAENTYATKEEIETSLTDYAKTSDVESTYATKASISDMLTKTEAGSTYLTTQAAETTYLTQTDAEDTYATKEEVDEKLSSVYLYKGSVATKADLPTTGEKVGDVWNVQEDDVNYAWDGTEWDALGPSFDSSLFATQEDLKAYTPLSSFETPITADNKGATMHDVEQSMADFNPLPEQQGHTGFLQTNGATATWSDKEPLTNNGTTDSSLAIGDNSSAPNPSSTSVGIFSKATGLQSTSLGYSAQAAGSFNIAIGNGASTKNSHAIAIGNNASAIARNSIQIGPGDNNDQSTLKVALTSSDNYQLLNSDGTIPAERFASDPAVDTVLAYTENGTAWLPGVTQQWVKDNFINSDASTYTIDSLADAFSFSKAQLMKVFNEDNMPTKDPYTLFSLGWTYGDSNNAPSLIAVNLTNGKMYFYQGTEENCTPNAWKEFNFGATGAVAGDNLKGVYCTTYGIVTLPQLITTAATENVLNIPAGMVLKTPNGRMTNSSAFTHTVESTSNFTLFYAGGSWLECGKVDYQVEEPEDNGTDNYQAWWNGTVWQFKSNDTGNVWREVASATPVCDCFFTGTNMTRIETVGYLWENGEAYVHKTGDEEIYGTKRFMGAIQRDWSADTSATPTITLYNTVISTRDSQNNATGYIENVLSSSGRMTYRMTAKRGANSAYAEVGVDEDGSGYFAVPTAPGGTNNLMAVNTQYLNDPTLSTGVVHTQGNETIAGGKTFTSYLYSKSNDLDITKVQNYNWYPIKINDVNNIEIGNISLEQSGSTTSNNLTAIAKKTDGTNVFSQVKAVATQAGVTYGIAPVPPARATGNYIATCNWINDYTLSPQIVHVAGAETITGSKTFTNTVKYQPGTDLTTPDGRAHYLDPITVNHTDGDNYAGIEYTYGETGNRSMSMFCRGDNRQGLASVNARWDKATGKFYVTSTEPDDTVPNNAIVTKSMACHFAMPSNSFVSIALSPGGVARGTAPSDGWIMVNADTTNPDGYVSITYGSNSDPSSSYGETSGANVAVAGLNVYGASAVLPVSKGNTYTVMCGNITGSRKAIFYYGNGNQPLS